MCLFDHMSVADNLRYGQRRRGRSPAVIAAADVIRVLDLGHLLTRSPAALSGGERQRAALGRCLLSDPRLLLLDEPLAALDAARIEQIVPYLRRVAWEFARPMFLVSHSVSEVRRLAERVLTIDAGRITGSYAINDQRWRRGRGRRGAELVGRVLRATAGSSLVDVDGQSLRVRGIWPVASQVMLRYDPSAVILSATPPAALAALTWLEGTLHLTSAGDASEGLIRADVTAGRVTIEALTGTDALREAGLSQGSRVWAILADGGILTESVGAGGL